MTVSAKKKAQLLQQRQLAELLRSIDPPRNAALLIPKEPEIVQPSQMSVWAREAYEPPKHEFVRRGADDHFKYKSKGI